MVFPWKRPPTGYPMPSSQLWNHIHTRNTAQTEQVMLMYLEKHTLKISTTDEWDPEAESLVVASPQAWLVPQQLQSIQKSWNVHGKLLVLNLIQISAKESSYQPQCKSTECQTGRSRKQREWYSLYHTFLVLDAIYHWGGASSINWGNHIIFQSSSKFFRWGSILKWF